MRRPMSLLSAINAIEMRVPRIALAAPVLMALACAVEEPTSPEEEVQVIIPSLSITSADVAIGTASSGGPSQSVTSVTTGSAISAGEEQLYIAQVNVRDSIPPSTVSSVSGGGLTWELVGAKTGDRDVVRVEVWKAFGSPSSAFNVTASFTNGIFSAALTVLRYDGADDEVDDVSTAGTGGTDNDHPQITTTSSTPGAMHFVALNPRHREISIQDPDYDQVADTITTLTDGLGVNSATLEHSVSSPGPDTFSATLNNSADWAIVAFVINPSSVPPFSHGFWIDESDTASLVTSGSDWNELVGVAEGTWPDPINLFDQDGKAEIYVLSGALAFAATYPDVSSEAHRQKVADYLDLLIAEGFPENDSSALGWARNAGAFVIAADIINLEEYDPGLNTDFVNYMTELLTHPKDGDGMDNLLDGAQHRAANIGAYARWSAILVTKYIGDETDFDDLVGRMKNWLGEPGAPFVDWDWSTNPDTLSWQEDPNDTTTFRGVVRQGVVRDGNNFDGILPEEMRRNAGVAYEPTDFPIAYTTRYVEESLDAALGTAEVLRRLDYDAYKWGDYALGRAAARLRYFAEHHSSKGWVYFIEGHEATRPLVNWLYDYGFDEGRNRTWLNGANKGYGFTQWSHCADACNRTVADGQSATLGFGQVVAGDADGGAVTSVTTADPMMGSTADLLYIAQVNLRDVTTDTVKVTSISGGGLTWTLVRAQDSSRGVTRVEVWKAFGSPASSFSVTANLDDDAVAADLTVTSFVDASPTLQSIASANTPGADGPSATDTGAPEISTTSAVPDAIHFVALNPRQRRITGYDADYFYLHESPFGNTGDDVNSSTHEHVKSASGNSTFSVTLDGTSDWSIIGFVINPS